MQKKMNALPFIHATLATLLMSLPVPVLAHEQRTSTSPAQGSILHSSPTKIGVEFDGGLLITQFEVTGPDGSVRLDSHPGRERVERYFVKPGEALSVGDYQVRWRGLSDDGHLMSDGFNFSVEY